MILNAASKVVMQENLKREFNPSYCDIINETMDCDEEKFNLTENALEAEGYVVFENGKVVEYEIVIDGYRFSKGYYDHCFDYVIVNNEATITGYDETCGDVVSIPRFLGNTEVTKIGANAFKYKNLSHVYISDEIKEIGDSAFLGNNMTIVNIPENVEVIGANAFNQNKIEHMIYFNSAITSIGENAFGDGVSTVNGVTYGPNVFQRVAFEIEEPDHESTLYRALVDNNQFANGVSIEWYHEPM